MMRFTPMPLVRVPHPFDHPDWLFELKHDGFRALAHVTGHRCDLISRRGVVFRQFPQLAEEIAHSVRSHDAILDGEIVCLDDDGRSNFHKLLFRRDWPFFFAFDILMVDGEDLRDRRLVERKRRLRLVMPRIESRLRLVESINARGVALFDAVCRHDLEGIVAKWRRGPYSKDGVTTSWIKIKNPDYSQIVDRHELFEARRGQRSRTSKWRKPILCPDVAATYARSRHP
jgi:bifunctional non-homologous end joining protein LigD